MSITPGSMSLAEVLRRLGPNYLTDAPNRTWSPAEPLSLASTLQQLGTIGNRQPVDPISQRQTIVAGPGMGRQQTINVNAGTSAPAGAATPSTADESSLASQAGWAGANEAVAPYLGDWRATPAQILTAAVGGYQRSRYAAQQDIAAQRQQAELFGLKKQEMEDARAEAQRQRELAAKRQAALQAGIVKLPPEMQQQAQMLLDAGETDALAKLIAPERKVVGDALVDPMTGRAVYQAPPPQMTPYQAAQYALDSAKFQWQKTHPDGSNDPPVAIQGPDGQSIYVPRSQSYGHRPADTRELAGSEGEREDKRLVAIRDAVVNGGWNSVSPADASWYEMKYREKAQPKVGFDIPTGLMMSTSPDMSFYPTPPSLSGGAAKPAPQAQPSAPVEQDMEMSRPAPGGQTIMNKTGAQEPTPTIDNGPPSPAAQPPVQFGSTAGTRPIGGMATRDQTKAFNDAISIKNDIMVGINKVRGVLTGTGGYGALAGENKKILDLAIRDIVTQVGKAGNAGVLAPTEVSTFKDMLGDPTSIIGFIGNATGINPIAPALQYLEDKVNLGIENRGKEIGRDQIPPPDQRVADQIYVTPRGPMRWTGTGWLPVTGN